MGLLHGLPISLKDQFHVKGNDTAMGYIGWIDTFEGRCEPDLVHKVDSQIVSELLSLGAVLCCKVCWQARRMNVGYWLILTSNFQTSLPQTLFVR